MVITRTNAMAKTASSIFLCSGTRRRFALIGGVYVLLWVATWYSASLLDRLGVVSLWFLPAGLRFCALLVFGWLGVLLEFVVLAVFALFEITAIVSTPLADLLSAQTFWRLTYSIGSLATTAMVVFALRWRMGNSWDFTRPLHSALFFVCAVFVSALSALVGTYGLMRMGAIPPAEKLNVFTSWVLGDLIGIMTVVPLLLLRVVPGVLHYLEQGSWPRTRQPGAAGERADLNTVLVIVLALLLVFGLPWSLGVNRNLPLVTLLLLLPLAAIALHYGLRPAVLAFVLLDGGLVVLIAVFGQQEQASQYQLVMIAIALVGLWLGGSVESRNRLMARYRDFASVSNDLLWEFDRGGRLREASGKLAAYAALSPGQSWRSILDASESSQLVALEDAVTRQLPFHHLQFALSSSESTPRWVQVNGLPLFDELGELVGYRGTAIDVSVARQAETVLRNYNERLRADVLERTHELRESNGELAAKERHLQVLLAAVPVGVLELDAAQCCRYLNANGCALTACSLDEARGRHFLEFVHPDDREYVNFVWQNIRQSEDVQLLEFRLNRTNLRCAAHWIKLSDGDPSQDGTIMVLTNATARSRQDERLWTLAHHDTLTDLPNRNLFWDRLGQALRHAHRHGTGAAVLWIDLDGFKAVNDRLGHAAGDRVLKQVAARLRKRVRESDTVARIGGDEFAVIMPDIAEPGLAVEIARQLVAALAESIDLAPETVSVSGSIGVALYPQHAQTAEVLTQCADVAMYAAKHAGKNQVSVWNGS